MPALPHRSRPPGPGPGPVTGGPRRRRDDRRVAWLFLAPVLIGFAVFYLYPTIRGLWYSLTDYSLLTDPEFVGPTTTAKLVSRPRSSGSSMRVTALLRGPQLVSQTLSRWCLAGMMHRLTRSVVLRAPAAAVAGAQRHRRPAVAVAARHQPGLRQPAARRRWALDTQGFLTDPELAMPSIALINTWAYTGYTALLLYAGMLQIPQHLYESAALDGAGELRMFRRITLPLLRPILALVLVVSLIGSFQIFDTVAVTTQGRAGQRHPGHLLLHLPAGLHATSTWATRRRWRWCSSLMLGLFTFVRCGCCARPSRISPEMTADDPSERRARCSAWALLSSSWSSRSSRSMDDPHGAHARRRHLHRQQLLLPHQPDADQFRAGPRAVDEQEARAAGGSGAQINFRGTR